jgi:hypothetical protein
MASWGLVATVKAPEDKVLAFVAHHLAIGAGHLAIYFDDPDAPVPEILMRHPKVSVTRCDDAHWATAGKNRPPQHQNRQTRNARHALRRAVTDWLVHIDVDEFIHTPRPLADILEDTPPGVLVMKLEPFEAMHDPLLPDDIYTAREFRGALRHEFWPSRRAALGDYRKVIRDGMLSHTVGKVIFRTRGPKLMPKIHTVMLDGTHVPTPDWHPELRLLHFHAQDRKAWLAALSFRLTKGAYQFRPELQKFLAAASPAEIDDFYLRTQVLPMDLSEELQRKGRVLIVDLHLRDKVRALQEGHL